MMDITFSTPTLPCVKSRLANTNMSWQRSIHKSKSKEEKKKSRRVLNGQFVTLLCMDAWMSTLQDSKRCPRLTTGHQGREGWWIIARLNLETHGPCHGPCDPLSPSWDFVLFMMCKLHTLHTPASLYLFRPHSR